MDALVIYGKESKCNMKIKAIVFKIISVDEDGYLPSKIFDVTMMILIILSIISVIISTFDNIPITITSFLNKIEYISITAFTFEYISRIWTADLLFRDKSPIISRLKYIFSFMALIDLIAILPFYLPFITKIDLRSLRALRLVRMFRVLKLGRYIAALNSIAIVFKRKKEQLISSLAVVIVLMIVSSILIYFFEHDAQPNIFQNAFSGLWWSIATLTTVGYGDIYPITMMGKLLSSFIALLGIGIVAVPTGIISAGFSEDLEHNNKIEDNEEKRIHDRTEPILKKSSKENEITYHLDDQSYDDKEYFQKRFIQGLSKLNDDEWKMIEELINNIVKKDD